MEGNLEALDSISIALKKFVNHELAEVLPTSCAGYYAGKPIESAFHFLIIFKKSTKHMPLVWIGKKAPAM